MPTNTITIDGKSVLVTGANRDPMAVALRESRGTSFAKAFERENAALLQGEPQAA